MIAERILAKQTGVQSTSSFQPKKGPSNIWGGLFLNIDRWSAIASLRPPQASQGL